LRTQGRWRTDFGAAGPSASPGLLLMFYATKIVIERLKEPAVTVRANQARGQTRRRRCWESMGPERVCHRVESRD
jgi:hypothetical protein